MSDLYYTQEEIDQLQKDIIEKYFNEKDIHKNKETYSYRFYNNRLGRHDHINQKIYDDIKDVIENIKKFKIIGYDEGTYNRFISRRYYHNNTPDTELSRYVSFINIYGDIFTGIIDTQYYNTYEKQSDNNDHKYCDNTHCNKDNYKILLKAFSKEIETRISDNPFRIRYTYESFEIDIEKGILLPKIILKNILDNNLINQLSMKEYKIIKSINKDSERCMISNCSEKYKDFIDIIMKEREQQKEIEDLKSKLAEQTKLNDDICERMFELKEQMLKN
jgi:hypothetical protein